jgi:hypothetical protein
LALSRERRENQPPSSHQRGATLVGLQRLVMRLRRFSFNQPELKKMMIAVFAMCARPLLDSNWSKHWMRVYCPGHCGLLQKAFHL